MTEKMLHYYHQNISDIIYVFGEMIFYKRERRSMPRVAVKELALALMYLTRFSEQDRLSLSENNSWKGYPFVVLDELEDEGFINQGSRRSKSVHIYDKGLKQARTLLKKNGIDDWEE